jgi:RNA polymerase sigma-70 factor (ECF subfamily)
MVSLLKQRDEAAFAVLYDNYSAAIFGVISRIITDEESARDLLQEVFVKIWKSSASYDASKGRLFTWMLNIARNTAIDATRSKQFKKNAQIRSIEDSVNTVNRQTRVITPTDHIGIKEVLTSLKEENRIIIEMLYFDGYTQEEVSKELNMPLGTVKTRSRAAIQQLRELLKINQEQ